MRRASLWARHGRSMVGALVLCTGAAAVVTVAAYGLLLGYEAQLQGALSPDTTIETYVARVELLPGHVIGPEDVARERMPPRYVPATAFGVDQDPVGRTVRSRVLAGERIRSERLAHEGATAGLQALVAPGMRAVSVNLSTEQAVSGFLQAGDRIDLMVTLPRDAGDAARTTTVLQGVEVVAIDDRHELSQARGVQLKPQVTLLVEAEGAERVESALRAGRVMAALRSDLDLEHAVLQGVGPVERLGHPEERRRVAPDPTDGRPSLQDVQLVAGHLTWREPAR